MNREHPVPSPPQPASRWPGLIAAVGGEGAIATFTSTNDGDNIRDWEGGFVFRPNDCPDDNTPLDPCDQAAFTYPDDLDDNVKAMPLIHWSAVQCSTFSGASADVTGRAKRQLENTSSFKLEREVLHGAGAQAFGHPTPYITDANVAQLNGGAATPLAYALAWLQRAGGEIAQGQRLAIWAPTMVATMWQSAGVVRKENGLVLDLYDNIIIAGTGVDGKSPAEVLDSTYDTAWAYATLVPNVRLSEITVAGPTIDQTDNVQTAIAWRLGAVTFDPCVQLGVNVDICSPCCTPS